MDVFTYITGLYRYRMKLNMAILTRDKKNYINKKRNTIMRKGASF